MPYYTVSWEQDKKNHENVGNSYSEYMIKDLLRGKYGYDGVVCTDWFGGNQDKKPVMEAYDMGCQLYGEEAMRRRMEESGFWKNILSGKTAPGKQMRQ